VVRPGPEAINLTLGLVPSQLLHVLKGALRGPWVAQLVKHRTLDVGSGYDLRVVRSSPLWGSVLSMESA